MQELLENLQKSFDEKTYPIIIDGTYFLEKEKEQLQELKDEIESLQYDLKELRNIQ